MTKTLVKTDRNGTKYFEEECKCYKCNGTGIYKWYGYHYNGAVSEYEGVCYDCNGTGKQTIKTKEYTPEHQAKLNAKREAEIAKKQAEIKAQQEAEAKKQAEYEAKIKAEKAKSEYIGKAGDKIDMVVTVAFESSYEIPSFRGYGMTEVSVYGLKDEEGNLMVWKTSTGFLMIEKKICNPNDPTEYRYENEFAHKGDKIRIKATIKEHTEYKEQKQTILTRVKVLEIVEKAEEEA